MSTDEIAPISPDDTLLYESRVRRRTVIIAAAAGVLVLLASAIALTGPQSKVNEETLGLIYVHKRFPLDLIAALINGAASVGAALTLVFLYRAAHARNPARVKPFLRVIALVGGILAAVAGIGYQVLQAIDAHKFVTTGSQTYAQAQSLLSGGLLPAFQLADLLAALLVAVAFVMVSLQAMNVGLLTRFTGYLGMFAGALVIFPIVEIPVVQTYWLLAVAYLVSGRWPSGLPAAWRSGRAEPWPSSAEMRARRMDQAESRRGGKGAKPAAVSVPDTQVASATAADRTRSTTPKRKRKRRG
jgi:hypothetical protein